MKKQLLSGLAALALLNVPTLADNHNENGMEDGDSAQMQEDMGSGEQRAQGMSQEDMVASQRRVMQVLSDAGLTDVRIVDAAYLVQAMTPQNETVMMIVNSEGQPVGRSSTMGDAQQQGTQKNN